MQGRWALCFAAMRKQEPPSLPSADSQQPEQPRESPLSLSRLREAFAAMLGGQGAGGEERGARSEEQGTRNEILEVLKVETTSTKGEIQDEEATLGRRDQ